MKSFKEQQYHSEYHRKTVENPVVGQKFQKFWHPKVLDERIKKHNVLQNQVVRVPQKYKSPKWFLKSSGLIF